MNELMVMAPITFVLAVAFASPGEVEPMERETGPFTLACWWWYDGPAEEVPVAVFAVAGAAVPDLRELEDVLEQAHGFRFRVVGADPVSDPWDLALLAHWRHDTVFLGFGVERYRDAWTGEALGGQNCANAAYVSTGRCELALAAHEVGHAVGKGHGAGIMRHEVPCEEVTE